MGSSPALRTHVQAPPKQTSSFSEATRVSEQKKSVRVLRRISDPIAPTERSELTLKSSELKPDRIAIELGFHLLLSPKHRELIWQLLRKQQRWVAHWAVGRRCASCS